MAVGMIKICEKCGEIGDSGTSSLHYCQNWRIEETRERERWPDMLLDEKCEWLKAEIERVKQSIPFDRPIG